MISFGGYTPHGADAALALLEVSTPRAVRAGALLWSPLYARAPADVQLARSGHTAALVSGERLLVFGGLGASHTALGDVLSLDVSAEGLERLRHKDGGAQWEAVALQGAEGCDGRYNHACAVVRGAGGEERLLVVGGNGNDHEPLDDGFAVEVAAEANG